MSLSLLKAKKSVFNSRGVIIAINGENSIEAKRETNRAIFLIAFQVCQRYQDGTHYQERKLLPLQQKTPLKIQAFFNSFSIFSNSKLDSLIIIPYRADLFFYIVYDFGFYVIIQPSFSPLGNFIFGFPFTGNRFFIKTAYISKFFYSKVTFFKSFFELLIIHFQPLKVKLVELYQKISYLWCILLLTLKLLLVYNLSEKVTIVY